MKKLITIIILSLILSSCNESPIHEVKDPASLTLQTYVEDSTSPVYKIFAEKDGDLLYFDVEKQIITKRTSNPNAAFFGLFLGVVLLLITHTLRGIYT